MEIKGYCGTLNLILERRVESSIELPKSLCRNDRFLAALLSVNEVSWFAEQRV